MKSKLPKSIIKEFHLDLDKGLSVIVQDAPTGYLVKAVKRHKEDKSKVTVTYELE